MRDVLAAAEGDEVGGVDSVPRDIVPAVEPNARRYCGVALPPLPCGAWRVRRCHQLWNRAMLPLFVATQSSRSFVDGPNTPARNRTSRFAISAAATAAKALPQNSPRATARAVPYAMATFMVIAGLK